MSRITPAYTILSIDGGGIRGIIPCKVLEYIEKRLYDQEKQQGPRIAELFDLIAGTSTGGILACGASVKGENNRPKYQASDLLAIYKGDTGKKIFSRPTIGRITHFFRSLARSKFPADNIEGILQDFFGDTYLSETLTDLLITSYNTETNKPFYFKSSDCRKDPEVEDFPLWEIARSTSAAPTYFPPKKVAYKGKFPYMTKEYKLKLQQLERLSLIDGGVFANNPSMLAYIEARSNWREQRNAQSAAEASASRTKSRGMVANVEGDDHEVPFFVLSLGTGYTGKTHLYEDVEDWGMVEWVLPLIDILMEGVSESVHYQMSQLLPPYNDAAATPRYIRLNIQLDPEHAEMDDPSDENTARLSDYGDRIVHSKANKKALNQVCDLLMARYQARNGEL